MGLTIAQLRKMSVEDLIREHDANAALFHQSMNDFRNELARRDAELSNEKMTALTVSIHKMTAVITWLTVLMTVLTVVNLAVAMYAAVPPSR